MLYLKRKYNLILLVEFDCVAIKTVHEIFQKIEKL